ncbi:hypothetical protein YC2023_099098 [Brassica napus]
MLCFYDWHQITRRVPQAARSLGSLLNYVWLDPRKGLLELESLGPQRKLGFPDFPPITEIDGSKIDLVQTSGASQNTQSRARSRSRARARRRSLSQLPSHRFHSSGSDRDELVVSEVLEGSKQIPLREMKMQDSGKKLEDKSGLSGKIEKSTFLDTQVEEHIWLLPKAARRAQKQREQRAMWNASAGQLMKCKILSFPNRRGTLGRKRNL